MKKFFIYAGFVSLVVFVLWGGAYWGRLQQEAVAQVKTVDVEKVSVSLTMSNQDGQGSYAIVMQCSLLLDGSPEYQFTVGVDYAMGADPITVYQDFYDTMQTTINEWNDEQTIFNHSKLNDVVTNLETNLSW